MSKQKQQFVYTTCSAGILRLQFLWAMNNLLSYCGLVDAKIRASDIDLPVWKFNNHKMCVPIYRFFKNLVYSKGVAWAVSHEYNCLIGSRVFMQLCVDKAS